MLVDVPDMAAPLPILQTLWHVNEAEARRLIRQLVDRLLAQCDGADESIRLNDLQLDYVRAQYPDRKALDLIHGAVRLSIHVIGRDPPSSLHRWLDGCCHIRVCPQSNSL